MPLARVLGPARGSGVQGLQGESLPPAERRVAAHVRLGGGGPDGPGRAAGGDFAAQRPAAEVEAGQPVQVRKIWFWVIHLRTSWLLGPGTSSTTIARALPRTRRWPPMTTTSRI